MVPFGRKKGAEVKSALNPLRALGPKPYTL